MTQTTDQLRELCNQLYLCAEDMAAEMESAAMWDDRPHMFRRFSEARAKFKEMIDVR